MSSLYTLLAFPRGFVLCSFTALWDKIHAGFPLAGKRWGERTLCLKHGIASRASVLRNRIGRSRRPAAPPLASSAQHPNIVFVLTDDLSMNLLQFMPHVLPMEKDGVTFANYFVTDSLCCSSRSSIFTGNFLHNTGIFKNQGEDGGYLAFVGFGRERSTFATALWSAGYRTAMMGKSNYCLFSAGSAFARLARSSACFT
jgi:hypothetical protein